MSAKQQNDKVAKWIEENAPEWIDGTQEDVGAGDVAIRLLEQWKRLRNPTMECPTCLTPAVDGGVGYQLCANGHGWRVTDTHCTLCGWRGMFEALGDHLKEKHDGDLASVLYGGYWVMITGHDGVMRITTSIPGATTMLINNILGDAMHGLAAKSLSHKSPIDSQENA